MPELAGEAVGTVLQRTAGDQPTADAGAERDEHDVVDAGRRAEAPLGERGARRVVVDRDVASEALLQAAADVDRFGDRQVRRGEQDATALDEPGDADTDGDVVVRRAQLAHDLGDRVEDRHPARGRRAAALVDDRPVVAEDHTEDLGAADVDTDGGHSVSARDFSSRNVLRMRTSARRLTNPGSGTTSSMVRS